MFLQFLWAGTYFSAVKGLIDMFEAFKTSLKLIAFALFSFNGSLKSTFHPYQPNEQLSGLIIFHAYFVELDWGSLGNAYGLLRLPQMPELKGASIDSFVSSHIDLTKLKYKLV